MTEALLVIAFGLITAAFVTLPFRSRWTVSGFEDPRIADLEARRDSKFREIKDAEADLKSGKLTRQDFDRVNPELRSEAVLILEELDRVRADADRDPDGNG